MGTISFFFQFFLGPLGALIIPTVLGTFMLLAILIGLFLFIFWDEEFSYFTIRYAVLCLVLFGTVLPTLIGDFSVLEYKSEHSMVDGFELWYAFLYYPALWLFGLIDLMLSIGIIKKKRKRQLKVQA